MKDWERIRKERTDITDYVIHWIRPKYDMGKSVTFDILVNILKCGYLKPTFAPRLSIYRGSERPTIKGPYPAVCFTEQTLRNFIISCKVLQDRYSPYGIALDKRSLYQYGGRPVIYGSEDILGTQISSSESGYQEGKEIFRDGLTKEYQYLWVRYEPIPNDSGYVIDWTHEREWRCKVNSYHDFALGSSPQIGIPIQLPSLYVDKTKQHVHFLPKIIVSSIQDEENLRAIIQSELNNWISTCPDKYVQESLKNLPKVKIVILDQIEGNIEDQQLDWVILDGNNR